VSFFPGNDFNDDNFDFCKSNENYKNRYRPYYIKNNHGYNLKYHQAKLENSVWYFKKHQSKTKFENFKEILDTPISFGQKINQISKNFSFGRAMLSTFLKSVNNMKYQNRFVDKERVFENLNQESMEKWKYVFLKIKNKAKGKKIIILSIPSNQDYLNFKETHINNLGAEIDKFAKTNNLEHIDLLNELKDYSNLKEISLPCDGHWSEKGHEVVANIVHNKLKKWKYIP
jgi:hypothetical protein